MLLIATYVMLLVFAYRYSTGYKRWSDDYIRNMVQSAPYVPSISIVAPAYNEEKTIVDNVRSLLNMDYPKFEVCIVNDGSKDKTLELLINTFELVEVPFDYVQKVHSAPFKRLLRSTNPDYAKCYNDYRPGTGYEYCNYAFNIMSAVIEKVSGQRFDHYIVQHIMKPLGLKGSHCVDDLDSTRFATLYAMENGVFVPQPQAYTRPDVLDHYQMCKNTARLSAAGGVKITAMDLAKYMLMHMNYGKSPLAKARVISEASARRMQTVITDDANANTEKERAGLGLMRADEFTPGTELVGHTGGAYGLRSAMFFDPVKKYGFVVITNGSGSRKVLQRSLTLMRDHFIK